MKLLEEIRSRLEALRHRYQSTIDHTGLPPAASENPVYWQSKAAAMDDDAREILDLLGTPPPAVWHRASEKLPTEADGDFDDNIWIWDSIEVFLSARESLVLCLNSRHGKHCQWARTGITKPKPPEV